MVCKRMSPNLSLCYILVSLILKIYQSIPLNVKVSDYALESMASLYSKYCGYPSTLSNYELYYMHVPAGSGFGNACGNCAQITNVYLDSKEVNLPIHDFPVYLMDGCDSAPCINEGKFILSDKVYDELELSKLNDYVINFEATNCIDLVKGAETKLAFLPGYSLRWFGITVTNNVNPISRVTVTSQVIVSEQIELRNDLNSRNQTIKLVKDSRNRFFYEESILLTYPLTFNVYDSLNNTGLLQIKAFSLSDKFLFLMNGDLRLSTSRIKFKSLSISQQIDYVQMDPYTSYIFSDLRKFSHNFTEGYWIDIVYKDVSVSSASTISFSDLTDPNSLLTANSYLTCNFPSDDNFTISTSYAALSSKSFGMGKACMSCIEVICVDQLNCQLPFVPVRAFVYDECSSCSANDLKLSYSILNEKFGVVDISYNLNVKFIQISCSALLSKQHVLYLKFDQLRTNLYYLQLIVWGFPIEIDTISLTEKYRLINYSLVRDYRGNWILDIPAGLTYPLQLNITDINGDYGVLNIPETTNLTQTFELKINSNFKEGFTYTKAELDSYFYVNIALRDSTSFILLLLLLYTL